MGKNIKKIVCLGEEIDKEDWENTKIKADVLIYSYSYGCYDGSGMAVWRYKGMWAYDSLGHCSCYGPTDNIATSDSMKLSLAQLIEILEKSYSNEYEDGAIAVKEYLKKNY